VFNLDPTRNCQLDCPSDRSLVQAAKRKRYDPYATSPPIGIGLSWPRERQGKYLTRMDTMIHGKCLWTIQNNRTVVRRNQRQRNDRSCKPPKIQVGQQRGYGGPYSSGDENTRDNNRESPEQPRENKKRDSRKLEHKRGASKARRQPGGSPSSSGDDSGNGKPRKGSKRRRNNSRWSSNDLSGSYYSRSRSLSRKGNKNRRWLKPETFDGRGSFETFIVMFETCATYNGWRQKDKMAPCSGR